MAYAFKRSAKAISLTSSTTSAAFFANCFSPLLPILQFGIFAGIIIMVNFMLVIMLLPPATIMYERHIRGKYTMCRKANKPNPENRLSVKMETFFRTTWNDMVFKFRYYIVTVTFLWVFYALS